MNHQSSLKKFRIIATAMLLTLSCAITQPIYAADEAHATAYADALNRIVDGQAALISEMERIQSGEVAHYDFLQFEHLELLRFASALRYPPASLEERQQNALRQHAESVLQGAEELEWAIADFLRSHAVSSSALRNSLDIVSLAKAGSTSADSTNFPNLTEAAGLFQESRSPATLEALTLALDRANAELSIESSKTELLAQKKLLLDNASGSQQALYQVKAASLAREAEQMTQLFRDSVGQ